MLLKSCLLLVALFVGCSYAQSKVPVTVYYESLCPDSAKFINEQLYPAAKQFNKNVELRFVPYGKSSYTTRGSETEFECHHGPNECYGNKVHACAIFHIQGNSYKPTDTKDVKVLDYINCLMERAQLKSGEFPGKRCAEENEIHNWDTIEQCANSTEGSSLLRQYGDETSQLQKPLNSVPTVTFRQAFDSSIQAMALTNFRGVLCKNLNPAPVECRNVPGSSASVASLSIITLAAAILARFN